MSPGLKCSMHKAWLIVLISAMTLSGRTDSIAQTTPQWAQTFYSDQFQRKFTSVPEENRDVWVLLIIDTSAVGAEALGVPKDGELMASFFKSIFASQLGSGRQLHLSILSEDRVTEAEVFDTISRIAVRPHDALVVYYSGHGGFDQTYLAPREDLKKYDVDVGHFLATSSGPIFRWKLKNAMQTKGAQLNILITDCCANYATVDEGKSAVSNQAKPARRTDTPVLDLETPPLKVPFDEEVTRDLFFRTVGWVSIQACSIGDTATGTRSGGLFSQLLLQRIANPSSINDPIHMSDRFDWQAITHFVTEEGTVVDPTLSREEIDQLLANPQRTKWTECFAAGIDRFGVNYIISQSANSQPPRNSADKKNKEASHPQEN